jgi:hypothetical protein
MRSFDRKKTADQAFVEKAAGPLEILQDRRRGFSKVEKLRTRLLLKESGDSVSQCSMRCTPSL